MSEMNEDTATFNATNTTNTTNTTDDYLSNLLDDLFQGSELCPNGLICGNGGFCVEAVNASGTSISFDTINDTYWLNFNGTDLYYDLGNETVLDGFRIKGTDFLYNDTDPNTTDIFVCDCEFAGVEDADQSMILPYAGLQCEYPASDLCNTGPPYTSFCANNGTCIGGNNAIPGDVHMGCFCTDDYVGDYCEYRNGTAYIWDDDDFIPRERSLELAEMGLMWVVFGFLIIAAIFLLIQKKYPEFFQKDVEPIVTNKKSISSDNKKSISSDEEMPSYETHQTSQTNTQAWSVSSEIWG